MGLAVLPCYLGDPEARAGARRPHRSPELTTELWLITHQALKGSARVRAFMEIVGRGSPQGASEARARPPKRRPLARLPERHRPFAAPPAGAGARRA